MENMPYHVDFELKPMAAAGSPAVEVESSPAGWRVGLPVLSDGRVTLRPLKPSDAASLFSMLSTEEVRRFVSPPPADVAGFERFIEWAARERAAGRHVCYAVVPAGYDVAVGIVQMRQLDPSFSSAEFGVALGSQFWGTGLFAAASRLVLDFAFEVIGVHRMEARAAVQNGRGNGAMRKLGAVQEGVLRRSLYCRGQYFDQLLWSILADDWRQSRVELRPMIH